MSGLEEVKTVMLAEPLESYTTFYQEMEAKGQHYSGAYSIDIMSVTIESDFGAATTEFCSDTTNASLVSNDGQDMTSDGAKRRAIVSNEMVQTDSGWALTSTEELGPC